MAFMGRWLSCKVQAVAAGDRSGVRCFMFIFFKVKRIEDYILAQLTI